MAHHMRFQDVAVPLLQRAAEIGDQGQVLLDGFLPENVTFGSVPAGTVWRLHIAGTANFRSGIVCLQRPDTSVGAFTMLRGLLEVWSHLAFIADSTADSDVRCRALRYERGAMREWQHVINVATPAFVSDTQRRQHDENDAEIEHLWRTFKCRGAHRMQGHVADTLKTLAQQPGMCWIIPVWRATSATTHMYGVDFALEDHGDSTSDLVWALPCHRATWLKWLVAVYSYLTTTAANILQPANPSIGQFHEDIRTFVEHPILRSAIHGEYDNDY